MVYTTLSSSSTSSSSSLSSSHQSSINKCRTPSSSDNDDTNYTIGASFRGPKALAQYRHHPNPSPLCSYYSLLREEQPSRPPPSSSSSSSPIFYQLSQYVVLAMTYFAIVVLAIFAITCLFCLFLAIRLVDDMLKSVVPGRLWSLIRRHFLAIDWPGALTRWSSRLACLADWEKTRRTSLNPSFSERFANIDGDRLHAFLFSLLGLLGSNNNNSRRQRHHHQQPPTTSSSTP